MRRSFALAALLSTAALTIPAYAVDPDRDFSGNWVLDTAGSHTPGLGGAGASLHISQGDAGILCSTGASRWSYALDGSETRKRVGDESRNSVAKWEGTALLINTLVSGPSDYTVMERWRLSRDRSTLTIVRQIVTRSGQTEGTLVYTREGAPANAASSEPAAKAPKPGLATRPQPARLPDVTVPLGTRVLLRLINEVNTKRAKEGDRVYLQTSVPVAIGGHVVIPRNSDVEGTVTRTKPAGHVTGKGELFIRFDNLILPNGISRDFHARPPGEEGQVPGNGKSTDARTVMMGTGVGASIGGLARGLPGAAAGAGIGALAGVLLSRNQNVILRPGTQVEMVLDRDLVFHPDEIPANPRYR
jgi:hypothetical protein